MYLNKGEKAGGWNWDPYTPGKHIAEGIGSLAELVQFRDIDGDGKADYIGIGQLDGSALVYRNLGPKPNGWGWAPMNDGQAIASGVGAVGADVRWGRMEKDGRNSYLALSPNSGALRAWLNGCDDLSADTGGSSEGPTGGSSDNGGNSGSSSGGSSSSGSSGGSSGGSSSGGPSGGSSGNSGSGSGSSGDNSGQYIEGGLPIPDSGSLAGLGLATIGIPAIAALTPYAITAQNAVTTANQALQQLTSTISRTSAAVSQAAQALTIATQGGSHPNRYNELHHFDVD